MKGIPRLDARHSGLPPQPLETSIDTHSGACHLETECLQSEHRGDASSLYYSWVLVKRIHNMLISDLLVPQTIPCSKECVILVGCSPLRVMTNACRLPFTKPTFLPTFFFIHCDDLTIRGKRNRRQVTSTNVKAYGENRYHLQYAPNRPLYMISSRVTKPVEPALKPL